LCPIYELFLLNIILNWQCVCRFIEGDFDKYVKRMRQPHVWGGEPELLMLSHVLEYDSDLAWDITFQIYLLHPPCPYHIIRDAEEKVLQFYAKEGMLCVQNVKT
jgi:hypothetical protein